jgi:hypothetical protein
MSRTGYDYNKPRSFNLVTLVIVVFLAGAGYVAVKFGPVYWQGWKVDEILDQKALLLTQADVARLDEANRSSQAERALAESIEGIRGLGIEDQPDQAVEVFYSDDFSTLHARYQVVVNHPYGKPTVITMNRKVKVP